MRSQEAATINRIQNNGPSWRTFVWLTTVGCAALIAGATWFVWSAVPENKKSTTANSLPTDIGFQPQLDAALPLDVTLVNERGEAVRFGDCLGDKPIVLNLVYYQCPMLCHVTMDSLIRTLNTMQLRVGEDFDVVIVSFDPREGPELAAQAKKTALRRYGESGTGEGWRFFTAGDENEVRKLTDAVGFRYRWDEQSGQYAHAAGILIITPDGRISRYLAGVDFSARDLRMALVEATQGEIGTPTDQVLLLCFRYNPLTGKYGLAITRLTQVFGLFTCLAICGGVGYLLRRERQATFAASAPPVSS